MTRLVSQLAKSWLRFIDDTDMKWSHSRDSLDTFIREGNRFRMTNTYFWIPIQDSWPIG